MLNLFAGNIRRKLQDSSTVLIAISLALSGLMPIILAAQAGAAQLTSRRVVIASSQPAATGVNWDFEFDIPTGGGTAVQSIVFSFCTTPLGACVLPTGMNVGYATTSAPTGAGDQVFSEATNFTEYTGANAGGCNGQGTAGDNTATTYCVTRTDTDAETAAAKSLVVAGVTNPTIPSGNNVSVYVRIVLYSDTAFATAVHEGTVAASIVNQLNVTGRIQERLVFCVFALDDTSGSSGTVGSADGNMPTDCASNEANDSTNVDLGVIDNLDISYAPVDNNPPTDLGNDRFGAAMVNTNASSGVQVSYYATAATSGTNELRAFRVGGASCDVSGTSLLDQCFISADDSAGETLTAGTERFGMQLACVANSTTTASGIGTTANLGKDGTGTYTSGTGTSGSYNAAYNAGRTTNLDDEVGTDNCENDPAGTVLDDKFAWRDSATAQALISSVTVVDDEMIKFRYAATANATTPTGTYTVASTFIATPTF